MKLVRKLPVSRRLMPSARATSLSLGWLLGLVLALALGKAALDHAALHLLESEADHAALAYAQTLVAAVPELDLLLEDGHGDATTLDALRRVRGMGGVFTFRLYDRDGRLLLDAAHLDRSQPLAAQRADPPANAGAREALLRGHNRLQWVRGGTREGEPPLYAVVQVPIGQAPRALGVVEAHIDQSARAEHIDHAFLEVAIGVGVALLLLGAAAIVQALRHQADRHRAARRLRYLAEHDLLSGAFNRTSFQAALAQAARAHQDGGPAFAVLRIDIDHFSDVNNSLGPAVGDAILRQVPERLRALVRHGDLIARLDGDEFALLQLGAGEAASVDALGERVVEAMAEPFDAEGHCVLCTVSVGAACFGSDAASVNDLMHQANVALIRAKTGGRNRLSFYDAELDQALEQRRELARDLREALLRGELLLHYQPMFGGSRQQLLGYEALLRWPHPTRGMVPPSVFIPLAEASGQIEALGEWALRQACSEAARWPDGLCVSVNLSPAQFSGAQSLVAVVSCALADAGLPASRLEVEITESLLMGNTEAANRTLSALAAMGVRIAMDDFGTGYSSLAYLWRFPFDKVKIDRAFTHGLGNDDKVALIVRSIVTLAHALGLRVNAEGIETGAQLRALQALGCDELQGFLLGRPAPPEALAHRQQQAAEPAFDTSLATVNG
jgi:diguanylate cyclase (GGDEF)-like protein